VQVCACEYDVGREAGIKVSYSVYAASMGGVERKEEDEDRG
jgi:hypothetical protein